MIGADTGIGRAGRQIRFFDDAVHHLFAVIPADEVQEFRKHDAFHRSHSPVSCGWAFLVGQMTCFNSPRNWVSSVLRLVDWLFSDPMASTRIATESSVRPAASRTPTMFRETSDDPV